MKDDDPLESLPEGKAFRELVGKDPKAARAVLIRRYQNLQAALSSLGKEAFRAGDEVSVWLAKAGKAHLGRQKIAEREQARRLRDESGSPQRVRPLADGTPELRGGADAD